MAADPRRDEVHAIAVALADQAARRAAAPVLAAVPSGWRNVPNAPQQVTYHAGEQPLAVAYQVITGFPGIRAEVSVNGGPTLPVLLHACTADLVDFEVDGLRRMVRINRAGDIRYADSALGASVLAEEPRFPLHEAHVAPGSLVAPMPGTVVRVESAAGAAVSAGQVLVVLEAMKMEHSVRAPHDGTVAEILVSAGQAVDQGTVLAVLDEGGRRVGPE
jgi:biotin carboxyl carrier protein